MSRTVQCAKLGRELPGLPFQPFDDELGKRIYENVSMEAWMTWLEHSKMIINEYRLDLTQRQAHEILRSQCERFLFGEDPAAPPPDYVPPSE